MGHITRQAVFFRYCERLHQVPSREIRTADVAHLAAVDEVVERIERFFDRAESIESVQLVKIDVVSAQTTKACLARLDQVMSGRTHVIVSWTGAERGLCGKNDLIPAASDRPP